jgi:hypothetical protein
MKTFLTAIILFSSPIFANVLCQDALPFAKGLHKTHLESTENWTKILTNSPVDSFYKERTLKFAEGLDKICEKNLPEIEFLKTVEGTCAKDCQESAVSFYANQEEEGVKDMLAKTPPVNDEFKKKVVSDYKKSFNNEKWSQELATQCQELCWQTGTSLRALNEGHKLARKKSELELENLRGNCTPVSVNNSEGAVEKLSIPAVKIPSPEIPSANRQ